MKKCLLFCLSTWIISCTVAAVVAQDSGFVMVALSTAAPASISAGKNVVGAQFKIDAESVRSGFLVLGVLWEVDFRVSRGDALDLGWVTAVDESGKVFAEGKTFRFASRPNPLRAKVLLVTGYPSGVNPHLNQDYSLKGKTLSLVFETTEAFRGEEITITSVSLVGTDFGYQNQYGELVSFDEPISVTVQVLPVLTVSVSPTTPKCVSAADNVAGARFEVKAKSIRPGSPMLWRGWQLEFEVSCGVVSALGVVKVFNEAGTVIAEENIMTRGDSPRRGMVSLTAFDAGRSSGYSLKGEETLTVGFSTASLTGANITVTSVELLAADFGGTNLQYGDLVSSGTSSVSTTVRVEQPTPSGGGGGQIITPPSEPKAPSELPGTEITILSESAWYRRGPLPSGGDGWWCFVRLTEPLPENVVVWWDSDWSGQYPVPVVGVNGDGTFIGFPLMFQVGHVPPERLSEIGKVRIFALSNPP